MVRLLPEKSKKDYIGMFILITLGLQGFNLLVLMFQGVLIDRIVRKESPTLVQLVDGKAIQVASMASSLDRAPQTIDRFVEDTLTMLMTWSGQLEPESHQQEKVPKVDPGVLVELNTGTKVKIATSTWYASFALAEDFRNDFLRKIAEMTPQRVFDNRDTEVILVINNLSEPKNINPGKWKVSMVANLMFFRTGSGGTSLGEGIPFNKEIFIQAVNPPRTLFDGTAIARKVFEARQSGLEIYAMRDLEKEEIFK